MSAVTASVVRDLTLGDELQIVNHICILAATQGDGTLFHPNSFQEEDLFKLCIGLGQAHPEGVLWLLDTKTVLSFWSGSEMVAMTHLFTAAMAWHDKPINMCVCPPTAAQVREHVALRGRLPSGAQVQISSGEVVHQSSPQVSPGIPATTPPGH